MGCLYPFYFMSRNANRPVIFVRGMMVTVCLAVLSRVQVRVRATDQGWIYTTFKCRARNDLGQRTIEIDLKRASEYARAPCRVLLQLRHNHRFTAYSSLLILTNGPITIAIRARFEYDSSTIRLQHATTRYEVFVRSHTR